MKKVKTNEDMQSLQICGSKVSRSV